MPCTPLTCCVACVPPSPCNISAAPPVVADRVRTIVAARSVVGTGLLPERTADDDGAVVDLASDPVRETPLRPPTVGTQPLVLPMFAELLSDAVADSSEVARSAVGEVWLAGGRIEVWTADGVADPLDGLVGLG